MSIADRERREPWAAMRHPQRPPVVPRIVLVAVFGSLVFVLDDRGCRVAVVAPEPTGRRGRIGARVR